MFSIEFLCTGHRGGVFASRWVAECAQRDAEYRFGYPCRVVTVNGPQTTGNVFERVAVSAIARELREHAIRWPSGLPEPMPGFAAWHEYYMRRIVFAEGPP